MNPETLNQLLPQTQCRDCGFSGCLPYAQAMTRGEAAINLCAPGGKAVIRDLAQHLRLPEILPAQNHQNQLAKIDEAVCIGCTACIRACPTDAIMGASKLMHTVLADECTGCGLCIAPCPVDCIDMLPVADEYLPRARFLAGGEPRPRFAAAAHARARYEAHEARIAAQQAARKQHLSAKHNAALAAAPLSGSPNTEAVPTRAATDNAPIHAPLNAAALIAQAMARAAAQENQRVITSNRNEFRATQIKDAQQKALFRRYQLQAKHGSETEKAEAIAWLRQYKAAQQAKESGKSGK